MEGIDVRRKSGVSVSVSVLIGCRHPWSCRAQSRCGHGNKHRPGKSLNHESSKIVFSPEKWSIPGDIVVASQGAGWSACCSHHLRRCAHFVIERHGISFENSGLRDGAADASPVDDKKSTRCAGKLVPKP